MIERKMPERIYYTVDGEPFDDYFSSEVGKQYLRDIWLDITAAECAKEYYHDHDGWERSDWGGGVTFTLWREGGDKIGDFIVDMEARPSFSARPK